MNDIVYICKKGVESEELRYSLRSVCKNFPHRMVWIYGDCPSDIYPDRFVEVDQKGETSWEKVRYTLKKVFLNEEVTEDFWLFNDDFFVMKEQITGSKFYDMAMVNGTMAHQIYWIAKRHGGPSKYTDQLSKAMKNLSRKGYDTLNYAIHTPFLVNRQKGLEVLDLFHSTPMFRCLYGNYNKIPCFLHRDVKLVGTNEKPDPEWPYLSTSDGSFRNGRIGDYIREAFPYECRYECKL